MVPEATVPKNRHILVGLWLGLLLVRNGVGSFFYLTHDPALEATFPQVPTHIWTGLGLLGIGTVICSLAIILRRRRGFWGVCMASILAAILHIAYGTGWFFLIEPCSVLILFGLLKWGKDRNAWQHLG